ncbi:MFS transporter [Georgenia sp. Z1491]|uniref:MFS transporter n=1 Tax=Georgenia sp. Z1491 TaxID=3416707 RepID=UPI003CF85C31
MTATAALVAVLLALFRVAAHGIDPLVAALGAAGVVVAGLFVVVERRSPAPLVPMRIFRSRTLVGGNLVILLAGIAVDGLLILVTLYAQHVLGLSALQFGLTMGTMTVTSVVAVLAGQQLVTRFGFRAVAGAGLTLMAVAGLLLSRLRPGGTMAEDLLAGLIVFGVGMGAAFVAGQIPALADVPEHDAGLAAGVEETPFAVGTTMGAALVSAVAIGHATRGGTDVPSAAALTDGFAVAFLVLAALAILGAAVSAVLLRRPRTVAA